MTVSRNRTNSPLGSVESNLLAKVGHLATFSISDGVTPGADYKRIPVLRISREKPEGSELSTTRCGSMRTSTLPLNR